MQQDIAAENIQSHILRKREIIFKKLISVIASKIKQNDQRHFLSKARISFGCSTEHFHGFLGEVKYTMAIRCALLICVFFAVFGGLHQESWAISEKETREHLRSVLTVTEGVSAINESLYDKALFEDSTVAGLNWLEAASIALTAVDVAASIADEDYQQAIYHASSEIFALVASGVGGQIYLVVPIASLFTLPTKLGLEWIVDGTQKRSVNRQIQKYILARKMKISHEFIIEGKYNDSIGISFTGDGWILYVDGQTSPNSYLGEYPRNTVAKDFFELAKAVYDAQQEADAEKFLREVENGFVNKFAKGAGISVSTCDRAIDRYRKRDYDGALLGLAKGKYEGYGAPFNLFKQSEQLSIDASCEKADRLRVEAGTGSNLEYVYDMGYIYLGNGKWRDFSFSGSRQTGRWFAGSAEAVIGQVRWSIEETEKFVVAYICTWHDGNWKCGCSDDACGRSRWQIQGVVPSRSR